MTDGVNVGGKPRMDADERGWAEERERRAKSATFWSAAMERKRIRRFRARGELMRWMNVRPACESGGGLAPTTALQDAGARFGRPGGSGQRSSCVRLRVPGLRGCACGGIAGTEVGRGILVFRCQ
jgi:hypothetical protein